MSCHVPATLTTPTSVPSDTSDHFGEPEGDVSSGSTFTHHSGAGGSPRLTVIASGERSAAMAGAMADGGGAAALVAVSACPERVVPAGRKGARRAPRFNS